MLLPAEAELCNAVGLTEEEYWHFVELTEAYNGERSEEYALIPDVRNDPVSIIVSIVVGAALSAVSALLAPKPKQPEQKQPKNLKSEDINGRSKFAPQSSFDSLQELASLGEVIPLVFTRKGTRVNGSLLWSQMQSLGNGQQLRALVLFSSGAIEGRPDFAGYAIGDTTLENYTNAKLALYFKSNGGRPRESSSDRYSEGILKNNANADAFSIYWDRSKNYQPYFSGARTPAAQTQFGCYAPVPNGMMHRPQWDEPVIPDGDKDNKERLRAKRNKARDRSPYRAAVIKNKSNVVTYRLDQSEDSGNRYEPWGSDDIKQSQNSARESADTSISVGNQYMVGTAIAIGTSVPPDPWVPGYTKDSQYKIIESGAIDTASVTGTAHSSDKLTLQSVAIGTVSNNRACSVTEIGIKSTVWGQVSGYPNLNGYPGEDTLTDLGEDGGSFSYGSMSKYLNRISFFQLQIRPLGANAKWTNISGGTLFAIKGNTPQAQYNWIRINHAVGQWEFRLKPYPGNAAKRYFKNKDVNLLRPGRRITYSTSGVTVAFDGKKQRLDVTEMCNPEWIIGKPPKTNRAIRSVSVTSNGVPLPTGLETRYNSGSRVVVEANNGYFDNKDYYRYYWNGDYIGASYANTINRDGRNYVVGKYVRTDNSDKRYYEISRDSGVSVKSSSTVSASGGSGNGAKFTVKTYSNGTVNWTLAKGGTGYLNNESIYIPVAKRTVRITTDEVELLADNWNPYDVISDYPLVDSEKKSHMDGPEHEIVYVNEQVEQPKPNYDELAIAGLMINSSKEWTSFSSLSAYFKRGVIVDRIGSSGRSATNLMPEIAYALLTDATLGAGRLIGVNQVDRARMATAAKFCAANKFYWDGVVADRQNLREWIFANAGYCLLDFTIIGGRFSLVPSVPTLSSGKINFNGKPNIKALFTDGNIRNMKVSFLSPEERQLFRASVLWRQEKTNGFPETRTLNIRLSNAQGGNDADPEESFDLSGFCTSQEHAATFARYALKLRKEIDHGVTFETTPQAAMNLMPGDHFRLVSEVTHTSRFNNGSIGPDGSITAADELNGNYSILYWEPGTTGVRSGTLKASNNKTTQGSLFGTVFTINNSTTVNRVYKCETLTYAEDGLVEVAASYEPLTSKGTFATLNWGSGDFLIEAN